MGRGSAPCAEATTIARLVRDFLTVYAPSMLTGSPHTIKSHRAALSAYLSFLEARGVTPRDLSASNFDRRWIEEWVGWLKSDRGNSNDTCNVRLASLRTFLDYAGSREPAMLHPCLESRIVRRQIPDKTKVEGMSRRAVAAILAAPGTDTATGRRDTAFFTLMYSTAARLGELRVLTAGQVFLEGTRPYITVRGKGGKVRSCYLIPKTAAILRAYMEEALGPDRGPGDLLFPSPVTKGPLTDRAWDKRLKKHAAKARETCPEVPSGAHCHQLRHAKASHWIEDGVNVVEVQFLLGHEQLDTTMRYLDISVAQKLDALETIEGDGRDVVERKWKNPDGTLRGLCGLAGAR